MQVADVFEDGLDWLRRNYGNTTFFVERDLVWTLQRRLSEILHPYSPPLRLYNDYAIIRDGRHRLSLDLAFVSDDNRVLLGAEFKYEPSHNRADIPAAKFPVVAWGKGGVGQDVERVRQLVAAGRLDIGYAVFVDEAGFFGDRAPFASAEWVDWGAGRLLHRAVFRGEATDPAV